MSTTINREVAMSYAGGNGDGAGFVFEIPQGMVDRGASIDFLSQVRSRPQVVCGL